MPNRTDAGGSQGEIVFVELGSPTPPPAPPTASPTGGPSGPRLPGAPVVSSTPNPGQGVALDAAGKLAVSVNATISGFELAYAELVSGGSSLSITGVSSAAPTLIVTAPSIIFDGQTTIIVSFFTQAVQKGTTSLFCGVFDGTSLVCPILYTEQGWAPGGTFQRRITPTQGPHQYSIKGWVDAGTGMVSSGDGASGRNSPAFIQIARA